MSFVCDGRDTGAGDLHERGPSLTRNQVPLPRDPDELVVLELTRRQADILVDWVATVRGQRRALGKSQTADEDATMRAVLMPSPHVVTTLDSPGVEGSLSGCTITEAGQRLGLTRWGVRKAIARGALAARQTSARAPYVVDERSVARFARSRRTRATTTTQEPVHGHTRADGRAAAPAG